MESMMKTFILFLHSVLFMDSAKLLSEEDIVHGDI